MRKHRHLWLAAVALAAAACTETSTTPLAPTDSAEIHEDVVENAHQSMLESVEDLSCAPPPMTAYAERS